MASSSLSGGGGGAGGGDSNNEDSPSASFSKASGSSSSGSSRGGSVNGSIERSKSSAKSSSSTSSSSSIGSSSSLYAAEAEAWSRVQLLRARLREATSREDYAAASALRDALAAAVDALPLPQRHVLAALDAASSPSSSSSSSFSSSSSSLERAAALLRAADHVRPYAFAQLASFLPDADGGVAAAAERALATAFRVPPDEAAAARMDEGDAALEAAATAGAMGGGGGGSGSGGGPPRRRSALSRAIAAYSSCAASHPDFAEAHNAKATALYVAGDPEGSLAACEVVMDLNPHHFR